MENQSSSEKKQRGVIVMLLLLSLVGNVVLFWMWYTKKAGEVEYIEKIKLVEGENRDVKSDLLELKQIGRAHV